MGELTGKQRDRGMNRPEIGIQRDDTLLVAGGEFWQREFIEIYTLKFDKR